MGCGKNELEELKKKNDKHETDYTYLASTASLADSTSSVPAILDTSSEAEIVCSICAEVIENYVPKYFLGEPINPACENCQDSSISSDDEQNYEIKEPFT